MRSLALIAAAAACCMAAPAGAQPRAPAAAVQPSPEQRAAIAQAVTRGRALFAIDRAGALTTRDMLVRLSDPAAAGVIGWIPQQQGNAIQVTYYAREGDNYVAVYRGQLLGGRVVSPEVFQAGSRPPLDAIGQRMAAAREAVAAKNNRPCGGEALNAIALPPGGAGEPIQVYQLSPRAARERVPLGGHYLTTVAADGTAGDSVPLGAAECTNLTVPTLAAGAQPRPLAVAAPGIEMPGAFHVFLSLWTGHPIAVAAGTPARMWGVTHEGIGELRQ